MSVGMPKLGRGIGLAREIVRAADVANDQDGRTTRKELDAILSNEGYGKGDPIRRGTMALFRQAKALAHGKAPTAADLRMAARADRQAIAQAAAGDDQPRQLSQDEFATLDPKTRAVARFAERYGNDTLDEYFF